MPRVRFFWTTVFNANHPLQVNLRLLWTNELPRIPPRVTITSSHSAAFELKTALTPSAGKPGPCQPISVMSVFLPGVPEVFRLPMTATSSGAPLDYRLCDVPATVEVSAVVPSQVVRSSH